MKNNKPAFNLGKSLILPGVHHKVIGTLKRYAKEMRCKRATKEEKIFRNNLSRFAVIFRCQFPIISNGFCCIADFFVKDPRILEGTGLIIEVDGEYHLEPEQKEKDELRDHKLRELGFSILRLSNEEVMTFDINQLFTNKIEKKSKKNSGKKYFNQPPKSKDWWLSYNKMNKQEKGQWEFVRAGKDPKKLGFLSAGASVAHNTPDQDRNTK